MAATTCSPARTEGLYVVLSPHLDDAVLSCGGLLHQLGEQGRPARVVTCFAGIPDYRELSPFAAGQHLRWGQPADPVSERRAEDRTALSLLGVSYEHWPYLDCIYRRDRDSGAFLYTSEESLFGQVAPADHLLVARLVGRVKRRFGSNGTVVYAPLSAGRHVDHQLVRLVALQLAAAGYLITYYEDYPYAEQVERVAAALSQWDTAPQTVTVALSEQDLAAKTAAIETYGSQLQVLFGGKSAVSARVRAYALACGAGQGLAERYYWWLSDL